MAGPGQNLRVWFSDLGHNNDMPSQLVFLGDLLPILLITHLAALAALIPLPAIGPAGDGAIAGVLSTCTHGATMG